MNRFPVLFRLTCLIFLALVACASEPSREDHSPNRLEPSMEAPGATLLVNGLSCPKCANNVDLQLREVVGVKATQINMSTGEVQVWFEDWTQPSSAELSEAIERTGFTLVEVRLLEN